VDTGKHGVKPALRPALTQASLAGGRGAGEKGPKSSPCISSHPRRAGHCVLVSSVGTSVSCPPFYRAAFPLAALWLLAVPGCVRCGCPHPRQLLCTSLSAGWRASARVVPPIPFPGRSQGFPSPTATPLQSLLHPVLGSIPSTVDVRAPGLHQPAIGFGSYSYIKTSTKTAAKCRLCS